MKKQLMLFIVMATACAVIAMKSPEEAQVASSKNALRLQNPNFSEAAISRKLLLTLVETGSKKDLPIIIGLLKEGKIDTATLTKALPLATKSNPAIQVVLRIAYINQLLPDISEEAFVETLLRELTACECKEALEWALKEGIKDVTGAALETAISFNFYSGAVLLLQYGAKITDGALKWAQHWANNKQDYRYINLLKKPHMQAKIDKEREQLLGSSEIKKMLDQRQLPFIRD